MDMRLVDSLYDGFSYSESLHDKCKYQGLDSNTGYLAKALCCTPSEYFHKKNIQTTFGTYDVYNQTSEDDYLEEKAISYEDESIATNDLIIISMVFEILADKWSEDIAFTSNTTEIIKHPIYRAVTELGRDVIKPILKRMDSTHEHWFYALSEITNENPVKQEHHGFIDLIINDWIEWGEANVGYKRK